LSLRPHPLAWALCVAFPLVLFVAMVEQIGAGHPWLALLQLPLSVVMACGALPELLLRGSDPPCCLAPAEGEASGLELRYRSGRCRRVHPAASTLVWNRGLLLVLKGEGGPAVRLLLGPGNVPPEQWAVLRRQWLRPREGLAGPLA
jgi:hypothetical protein